jgi:hypothetical protein
MKNIPTFQEFINETSINEASSISNVHADIADERLENITISDQNWRNVLDFIKCDPYVSISNSRKGWEFSGDKATIWTSNNPSNGQDFDKKKRGPIKPGFAGDVYIYSNNDKDLAKEIADMIKH